MSESKRKRLVVLETGLFPDAATLEGALSGLDEAIGISRHDLRAPGPDPAGWDRVAEAILAADKVVTV